MSKKKKVGISLLVIFGLLVLLSLGGQSYDHCYQLMVDSAKSNANAQRYMSSGCPENADKWSENKQIIDMSKKHAQENANMKKFLEENNP